MSTNEISFNDADDVIPFVDDSSTPPQPWDLRQFCSPPNINPERLRALDWPKVTLCPDLRKFLHRPRIRPRAQLGRKLMAPPQTHKVPRPRGQARTKATRSRSGTTGSRGAAASAGRAGGDGADDGGDGDGPELPRDAERLRTGSAAPRWAYRPRSRRPERHACSVLLAEVAP